MISIEVVDRAIINPLDQLFDAVKKSAVNKDERLLTEAGRIRILNFYNQWNEVLDGLSDTHAVAEQVAKLRWASRAPYYVHTEMVESGYVDYPTLTLAEKAVVEGRECLPVPDFLTRILFKLGVFAQDQDKPPAIFGSMPTFIPGISLIMEMNSYNPFIRAQMDLEIFQQALSLPLLSVGMGRSSSLNTLRSFAGRIHPRRFHR